jgi:hypothetical protein
VYGPVGKSASSLGNRSTPRRGRSRTAKSSRQILSRDRSPNCTRFSNDLTASAEKCMP